MRHFMELTAVLTMLLVPVSFTARENIVAVRQASAEEDWRKTFDDICAKTNEAMNLSDEELKSLIGKAEQLKAAVEKLDESERKVFLKRLQKCRDLFEFVLSTRKK